MSQSCAIEIAGATSIDNFLSVVARRFKDAAFIC